MNVIKKISALLVLVGVVLLIGCTSNDMDLPEGIPDFVQESDFEGIDWDKKAETFNENIIGNENKSGVIGADAPSLNGQKWMWHLWGIENPRQTELTVVGYHKKQELFIKY
ncbi:hypothetical protein [Psychrobacillus sp. L4]|uniref:hypothetical protein n=1 Tax=Psychrobacillus sp. L4 TaxID=3236892 RepID=UPI0036F2302B